MFWKILLLLRTRLVFRELGTYTIMGAGLSFVGDVLQVFQSFLFWVLVGALVLLAGVVVWSAVLLTRWTIPQVKEWARLVRAGGDGQAAIPAAVAAVTARRLRDLASAMLFLLVTSVIAKGTLVARHEVGAQQDVDTHGLFATLVPAIRRVQNSLTGVERDLGEIKGTLKNVKLETSDDPRKELANLGVGWSGENFLSAVKVGDERVVRLFLAGGMNPQSAESQGRPLPIMLAQNQQNPGAMLDLLVGSGLDPNQAFPLAGGMGPTSTTLIGRAIESGNVALTRALVQHGADLNRPIETFAAMGLSRQTFPLASAVYWKQYEIAGLLLDAGADKSVGDYAAFREIQAAMSQPGQSEGPDSASELAARLAPTGPTKDRVDLELRLREVEAELNDVALRSLRAPPGSSERDRSDRRYEELQQERTRIKRALGGPS